VTVAGLDAAGWVRSLAPFRDVPAPLFERVAPSLDVSFQPAGTRLVAAGGEPLRHLWIIRKGAVRLERGGEAIQVLEEGESFGNTTLLGRRAPLDVVVEEDLVAYRLGAAAFDLLLGDAGFARHWAAGVAERFRASLAATGLPRFGVDLEREVRHLAGRAPAWISAETPVGAAARRMRDERISSLLVHGEPPGIVTDRDLRTRVLAEGRGPATPVGAVCSRPLRTVPAGATVHEAWIALLDARVHHLPLTAGGGIVGVLTSTDFLRYMTRGPIAVLRGVERLADRDRLPGYADRVAEMASALLAAGLDALVIAGFVARLGDALTRRVLAWAEADLGPAPAPWAWVVFGSEGRMEQTLPTDQDDALVYADDGEPRRDWYRRFAERVGDDLERAGLPACPGGYMARRWHGPLAEWRARFAGWIEVPEPQGLLEAAIFFDFRKIAGALDLEPLEATLDRAGGRPLFLRWLARSALERGPPAPVALRLRGDASTVDLKAQGLAPIVALARCYGLAAGARARSTAERLEAAVRRGLVSEGQRAEVLDALRLLLGLRLRRQLVAAAARGRAEDRVALAELDPSHRAQLKAALRAVAAWQRAAGYHFHADF
jgi:CBS domain-containing protein